MDDNDDDDAGIDNGLIDLCGQQGYTILRYYTTSVLGRYLSYGQVLGTQYLLRRSLGNQWVIIDVISIVVGIWQQQQQYHEQVLEEEEEKKHSNTNSTTQVIPV